MFCVKCGQKIDDESRFCAACGARCDDEAPSYVAKEVDTTDKWVRAMIPVGRSGWAIAAGYCGLLSFIPGVSFLAIIFSTLALRNIRDYPELHGLGRVWTGFILGGLGSAYWLWAFAESL